MFSTLLHKINRFEDGSPASGHPSWRMLTFPHHHLDACAHPNKPSSSPFNMAWKWGTIAHPRSSHSHLDRFKCRAERVPLPCCGGCPTHGLIDTTAHPRSSQGHLDSSNWPVWAEQPTVHHSVWEDHFYSHYTPQHALLLTIQNHRPGSGAGLLYEGI